MADDKPMDALIPEYPSPTFPTVYADGVANAAWTQTMVKFFFSRQEPSINVMNAPAKPQSFAQVVMPMDGFLGMFIFFETVVRHLVEIGAVREETLANLRALSKPGG